MAGEGGGKDSFRGKGVEGSFQPFEEGWGVPNTLWGGQKWVIPSALLRGCEGGSPA